MTADHYADAARRWATGAELVYRPIAADLVTMCPHPLAASCSTPEPAPAR